MRKLFWIIVELITRPIKLINDTASYNLIRLNYTKHCKEFKKIMETINELRKKNGA